jgi:hypothetical protein
MPRKMGTRFADGVIAAVRKGLFHLTDTQRKIRIDNITVERGSHRFAVNLRYTNLETGKTEIVDYPQ